MQVLAEMETDKALVEVPSPYAGQVVALHGEVGQIAHVGEPIVTFSGATQSGRAVKGKGAAAAASEEGRGEGGPSALCSRRETASGRGGEWSAVAR